MTLYSAVLFVHVVSALGIFAALSLEAVTLLRLRRSAIRRARRAFGWNLRPSSPFGRSACSCFCSFPEFSMTTQMSGWTLRVDESGCGSSHTDRPAGRSHGQEDARNPGWHVPRIRWMNWIFSKSCAILF